MPQPPERCLSRQAGIVRCCLSMQNDRAGRKALRGFCLGGGGTRRGRDEFLPCGSTVNGRFREAAGGGTFTAHFVGGGVPDAPHGGTRFPGIVGRPAHSPPRRGQDPSLQCKPEKGDAVRPRAGHARPLQRGVLCRGRHALPVGRRAACPQAAAEGSRPLPTMQTGKGGCR